MEIGIDNIISEYFNKDVIPRESRDKAKVSVLEGTLDSKENKLFISLEANFVPEVEDCIKAERVLAKSLDGINDVSFLFQFDYMIVSLKDAFKVYIPHIIRILENDLASLVATINWKSVDVKSGKVTIESTGLIATEMLNKNFSGRFSDLIYEAFYMDVRVVFVNNESKYERMRDEWKNSITEDIKRSMEEDISTKIKVEKKEAKKKKDSNKGRNYKNRGNINAKANGNILLGKGHDAKKTLPIDKLTPDAGVVTIKGVVFSKEARTIKNGKQLISICITDMRTSTCLKAFVSTEKWEELNSILSPGDVISACGEAQFDTYDNEINLMVKSIMHCDKELREDSFDGEKRVELHAHTKMSAMDGLTTVDELIKKSARWGHKAVAITDHGVVQSFPDAANIADSLKDEDGTSKIKVIYGMEGYLLNDDDQGVADEAEIDYKSKKTNHIIILVGSQEGMKNLYKLVSISHLNYFYKKPRIPKSILRKHRKGLILGSACAAGEVFQAILAGKKEDELESIAEFYDYLEIQPTVNNMYLMETGDAKSVEDLENLNRRVVSLGEKLKKPVVATTDAHYAEPENAIYRNILMSGMGYKDAERGMGLYLRTTDEMLNEFSYLGDEKARETVIDNTLKVAGMIDDGILPVPKGKFPPKIPNADEILRKTATDRASEIYGTPLPKEIEERLSKELDSIISNGYSVMYVSAEKLVQKSLDAGYLVGSRGSVGSSFAATMAGITEVNPLYPHYICPDCRFFEWGDKNKYDCGIDMPSKKCPKCGATLKREGFTIPFATFLGFDGTKEPDIDLNFAGEYQATAHKYVGEIFGEKNVFKAGTVSTIAEKSAFMYVKDFFEKTKRKTNKYEIKRLTSSCAGVKKTTGQHPGGIIIVPEEHEIYEFCPIQHPANDSKSDIITTHFDYHKIDQNLLKLDLLGHNIPSMIRQLQDMTGVDPLTIDLSDRKVLSIFSSTKELNIKDPKYAFTHGTFAIPEFGTSFVRQMLDDIKPSKFADLVRIAGFSHGTDVWLNNAQDYIREGIADISEVISTRDDIMNYLMLKGIEDKVAFRIMEDVRKNRPLKEEQLNIMKEHGVPDWYIDSCIKIQYMFPRAHAVAYVMMSFRMAWYKVYFPMEFYATYFTGEIDSFDVETIIKGKEECLKQLERIASMGDNATPKEKAQSTITEVAYEMYARGFEFELPILGISHDSKFKLHDGKILLPFAALENIGITAAKAIVKAYEDHPFDTVEDAVLRGGINKSALATLKDYGVFAGLPETAQISFFSDRQ